MWVRGSRSASTISRSTSTSLPSMRRSISLSSSTEMSRKSRGSDENSRSIFCIRIMLTVSRISATDVDSLEKAFSSSLFEPDFRNCRDTSLRASTISETPLISLSSELSGRRTVRLFDLGVWSSKAGASTPPLPSATLVWPGPFPKGKYASMASIRSSSLS